jgi:hypothetical protein
LRHHRPMMSQGSRALKGDTVTESLACEYQVQVTEFQVS